MRPRLAVIVLLSSIAGPQCAVVAATDAASGGELTQVRAQVLASLYGLELNLATAISAAVEDLIARPDAKEQLDNVQARISLITSKSADTDEIVLRGSGSKEISRQLSESSSTTETETSTEHPLVPDLPNVPVLGGSAGMSFFIWSVICVIVLSVVVCLAGCLIAPGCNNASKDHKWMFLTVHGEHASPASRVVANCINVTIILSLVTMTLGSVRSIHVAVPGIFDALEWWFLIVFSAEWLGQMMWCPDLIGHMTEMLTWIDVLAVLPSYGELFSGGGSSSLFKVARLFRLFRLFKLLAKMDSIKRIFRGLLMTGPSIALTFLMLSVTMYIPSVLMYYVEIGEWDKDMGCFRRPLDGDFEHGCSPFQDIIQSMYWGINTVTTVGYGDVTPLTYLGKFIAGISMVCGIISLALPIGMMATSFSEAMEHIKEEEDKEAKAASKAMNAMDDLSYLDGDRPKNSPRESEQPLVSGRGR